MKEREIAIVCMVAGISSRFGGKPKGLARVGPNGETLIEYSLKQALEAGITKIVLIVSRKTYPDFKDKLGDDFRGTPITYAFQEFDSEKRDKPWGTTEALYSAREFLKKPFIVCNGDDIYGLESFKLIVNHLKTKKENVTVGYKLGDVLSEKGGVNRGIFEIENNEVKNIKETFDLKKDNLKEKNVTDDTLCSMNLFGLQPEVINLLGSSLKAFKEKNSSDRKIECLLPEEIKNLLSQNKMSLRIYPTKSKWLGLTYPQDEEKIRNEINKIQNDNKK